MLECLHTKRLWLVRVEFLENGLYLLCNVLTKKPRKQACLRGFSFYGADKKLIKIRGFTYERWGKTPFDC